MRKTRTTKMSARILVTISGGQDIVMGLVFGLSMRKLVKTPSIKKIFNIISVTGWEM